MRHEEHIEIGGGASRQVNADPETPDPRRWMALAVVLGATFMGILDVFIVNVAAPSIQHGLKASLASFSW